MLKRGPSRRRGTSAAGCTDVKQRKRLLSRLTHFTGRLHGPHAPVLDDGIQAEGRHARSAVKRGDATTNKGNVTVCSASSNATLVGSGERLDDAVGFYTSDKAAAPTGNMMVIETAHPGQLALSAQAYDQRVAGLVCTPRMPSHLAVS